MFYGTYKNYEGIDVVEFQTREELDSWLHYEDEFAKAFGSVLRRKEWKNKKRIAAFLSNPKVLHIKDSDGLTWHLYRPAF